MGALAMAVRPENEANMMIETGDSPMWSRFVAAGRQLQTAAPELWPLVVQLIEGAAKRPESGPAILPSRALSDWRLIDRDALAVTVERMSMLCPESVAEIAQWAQAVARSRTDSTIDVPPRPTVVDQLVAETQPPVWGA